MTYQFVIRAGADDEICTSSASNLPALSHVLIVHCPYFNLPKILIPPIYKPGFES